MIRELKEENERLKKALAAGGGALITTDPESGEEVK